MAHTMRAILLASATAASLRGLRASKASSQGEASLAPGRTWRITALAPTTSRVRSRRLPARLMRPSRVLPPVECCRGVRPRKAARWRPEVNWAGSIANARLIAVTGPIPGTPSSSRLIGCALCKASNSASRAAISASRWATCCPSRARTALANGGMAGSAATAASSGSTWLMPCAATSPYSAAWPRSALASWVRCFTNSSRIFSSMPCAWASADFTATSAIPGRAAASAMASASMRSFLPRRTNGLTYCGGISRTRWPSASARRPQWCEPPHASSTTSVGASPARNASQRPRRSSRRSTGRSDASTPCSVKTCFDVSMARRLSSITDGPSGLRLDNPNHGTQRCPGAVHPNGQMAELAWRTGQVRTFGRACPGSERVRTNRRARGGVRCIRTTAEAAEQPDGSGRWLSSSR